MPHARSGSHAAARAALVLLGLAAGGTFAGECREVPRNGAEQALQAIERSPVLLRHCTGCARDEARLLRVRSHALEPLGDGGVVVNGERFSAAEVRAARERRQGPAQRFLDAMERYDPGSRAFLLDAMEEMLGEVPCKVRVNGAAVDLGELYVPAGVGRWENLGHLAGCETARARLEWTRPPGQGRRGPAAGRAGLAARTPRPAAGSGGG